MRNVVCALVLIAGLLHSDAVLAQSAPPDAYWSFDGSTDALVRGESRPGTDSPEPRFGVGVSGRALTIGSPDGAADRSVSYPVADLLHIQGGSASFWIKPLDWHGGDAPFHIMLRTMADGTYFLVYKYLNSERLLFLLGPHEKWTEARANIGDWAPDQWHHVACTWSEDETTLWVDGRLRSAQRLRWPLPPFTNLEPLSVGPGQWRQLTGGTSLIDELRVYDRVLGPGEIAARYLQGATAAGIHQDAGLIVTGACTPTVDGRVSEDEYAFAGTGFMNPGCVLSVRQSQYFLGHDHERLYVALSSPLPVVPPAAEATRDADLGGSERVELYLAPGAGPQPLYRLAVTPDGRLADARDDDPAWDCVGLTARHRVEGGSWTAEIAIPFASLGLDAPADGTEWRINLARSFATPPEVTCIAPVVGTVDDWSNFVTLRFRGDAPMVRISSFVDPAAGMYRPAIAVRGGAQATVTGTISSSTGRNYGDRTTSFTLSDGGRATPYTAEAALAGRTSYALALTERTGEAEQPLYQGNWVYEPDQPLTVFFAYTLHDTEELMVAALARAAGAARVRFLWPDGTVALERIQALPPDARYANLRFPLDFGALAPGDYLLRIDHVAADGAVHGGFEQQYRVPDLTDPRWAPYVDPDEGTVPPPWTPLQTTAATAGMLGRSYDLTEGFLISGLDSKGRQMLAAPARLCLDGQDLALTGAPQLRRLAGSDVRAEWEKRADLGRLQVRSHLTVHFDGYCEVSMTLSPPPGQTIDLQTLSLDFPFRSELITLARDSLIYYGTKTGTVGDYWCQTIADRPMLWVGNEEIGFNWIADDLSQWHYRDEQRNVEIVRAGEQALLRLNLVDTPLTLDAPRTIDFGFTLTPTRPLDPRLRRFRTDREWQMWVQPWHYFNYVDADEMDVEHVTSRLTGHDEAFLYMSHNFVSPFCPEWAYWEEDWRHMGRAYGELTGNPDLPPEVRNRSCYAEACLGSASFRSFHLHQLAEFFRRAPVHPAASNYYFDFSYAASGENAHHGCSRWIDLNGKPHPHVLTAQTREVALATYRMIKRSDPDAVISSHQGWWRNLPVHTFTEVLVLGEGVESQVATRGSYYDILTPELFRATMLPEVWGVKVVFDQQLARALYNERPEAFAAYSLDDPETRRALLHLMGYLMVHDVDAWWIYLDKYRPAVEALWAAQDRLGWDEQTVFHPYWRTDSGVTQVGPGSDRVLASAYSRKGNVLLAVLNDTDEPQDVLLALDLAKLGAAAGAEGHDVWEPERRFELSPAWRDTVPPRGFRMIVWAH